MRHHLLLLLSLSVLLTRMSAQPLSSNPADWQRGAIQRVECAGHAGQSYMLYLPPGYTESKLWPIIYAFDPGARGNVPVERYQSAAAKYGYIVAGSNNSRNGPWQVSMDAITAVWDDTHRRFAIDPKRIYTTGHSGGARVAFAVAAGPANAAGVIAGGAGMPGSENQPKKVSFATYAIVGDADFNYLEVTALYQNLQAINAPAHLHVFEGPHLWAPSDVLLDAVAWMELQAMKSGLRPKDEAILDAWVHAKSPAGESADSVKAWHAWMQLASDLQGLRDVAVFESKAASMKNSKTVKDGLRAEHAARDKETGMMAAVYRSQMGLADPATRDDSARELHAALGDLKKKASVANDSADRQAYRRALAGLAAQLREGNVPILERKDYALAAIRLDIAAGIPPDRPALWLEAARVLELAGNKKRAQFWRDRAEKAGGAQAGGLSPR